MIRSKSEANKYLTSLVSPSEILYSDIPNDKGGGGEHPGPHELLEASFASCMNMTVRMVLEYRNIPYDSITVHVDLDEDTEGKAVFRYSVNIEGDLDEATKISAIQKATNCPVRKTLQKEISFVNESFVL